MEGNTMVSRAQATSAIFAALLTFAVWVGAKVAFEWLHIGME